MVDKKVLKLHEFLTILWKDLILNTFDFNKSFNYFLSILGNSINGLEQ